VIANYYSRVKTDLTELTFVLGNVGSADASVITGSFFVYVFVKVRTTKTVPGRFTIVALEA